MNCSFEQFSFLKKIVKYFGEFYVGEFYVGEFYFGEIISW